MKCLVDKNIQIPARAKVTGMDNIETYTFAHPLLSTIDMQKELIGSVGIDLLFKKIDAQRKNQKMEDQRIILTPKLIVRETC